MGRRARRLGRCGSPFGRECGCHMGSVRRRVRKAARGPMFVGIDLGGTNIKCGVVDGSGRPLCRVSVPTVADAGPEDVAERMCEAARQAVKTSGATWRRVPAVGIGSPGTMDIPAGVVLDPPNLPGWRDVPLRDMIGQRLGVAAHLENDANAAAYGEFWVGAGKGVGSLVMFTLGTGIGGGIVVDHKLVDGAHSCSAEVGHHCIQMDGGRPCACGRVGCLEAYASATAVVKRTLEALDGGARSKLNTLRRRGEPITGKAVFDAASAGDRLGKRIVDETARYLAIGAVNLIHIINPEMVVYTGGMTAAGRPFLDAIRTYVRELAFDVPAAKTRVVYAKLGDDAGFIGAAGWAKKKYETSPS